MYKHAEQSKRHELLILFLPSHSKQKYFDINEMILLAQISHQLDSPSTMQNDKGIITFMFYV
jgi:hypothetical protein